VQLIAFALALREERQRVDQRQAIPGKLWAQANTSKSEARSTLWNPAARSSAIVVP
jgi:hypothetical protein